MAYEKQTWECGDVVTAEKLNHIEEGIVSASESGGGTVEVERIFIASVNGSWTVSGTTAVFNGGTGFAGTVADKIGGKTVIGFGVGAEDSDYEQVVIAISVTDSNGKPLLGTKGENAHGLTVKVLKNGSGDGGTSIDIYAICI